MSVPKFVAEFDIGGTWTRGYLLSGSRISRAESAPTPTRSPKKLRATLVDMLAAIARGVTVSSINISVAGNVRGKHVVSSANIPALTNFSFRGLFPVGAAITVDNDARAFLRRAMAGRSGLRRGVVLGITLGTGVGRAVAESGKVHLFKQLEHSEPWEKAYQRRRWQPSQKLAEFLSAKLQPLIARYHPSVVALGGGVIQKKRGLYKVLSAGLHRMYGVRVVRISPD